MTIPPRIGPRTIFQALSHPRWLLGVARRGRLRLANLEHLEELRGLGAVGHQAFVDTHLSNPRVTWDELRWLRRLWSGPLIVKGVMTADDAQAARNAGADGIVVSNHGGRQLDQGLGALQALPQVVDAVGAKLEVLVDGGVRRGTDVAKALALGARACLVGRPYVFGLSNGEAGVTRTLEMLSNELLRTLALLGCPTLGDLGPDAVVPVAGSRRAGVDIFAAAAVDSTPH